MLLTIALLVIAGLVQGDPPVETCKITKITDREVVVTCPKRDALTFTELWPVEWEDAVKVGDPVKLQGVPEGGWLPIASCKVRIAKVVEEATRNRVGERRMPTNWYIPKDCQGEKEGEH